MDKFAAILIFAFACGGAYALEKSTSLGPSSQMLVMEGIEARHNSMKTKAEEDLEALKQKTDAIVNCGKQNKFYNESTKSCV